MWNKRRSRRVLAGVLVGLGGVLMALAPEIWAGLLVLALGVVVELAGIALEHQSSLPLRWLPAGCVQQAAGIFMKAPTHLHRRPGSATLRKEPATVTPPGFLSSRRSAI